MWYHPGWVWKRCQKGKVLHKQGWGLVFHAMKHDSLEMPSGKMLSCYGMKSFNDFMDVERKSCTALICMVFFHVLYISSCKIWKISFFFHAQRFVVSRQRWSRQLCLPHAAARQKQSYQEENSSEETRRQSRVQWEVFHYLCYPHMLSVTYIHTSRQLWFLIISFCLKVWVCSSCGRAEIQAPQCVSEE